MKKKQKNNIAQKMFESCFSCHSEEARQVLFSFAQYVGVFRLSRETAPLYLRIMRSNEPDIIDALLRGRHPFLLFRNIKPDHDLVDDCISILIEHDPSTIYQPLLLALLGLLDMVYKTPSQGTALRAITLFDLNHIAKFLDERHDQLHETNKIILQILDYFYQHTAAVDFPSDLKDSSIHSMRIRLAFFDKKHGLKELIPDQLFGPRMREHQLHVIPDTNAKED